MENLNLKIQEEQTLSGKREWNIGGKTEYVCLACCLAMEDQGIELDKEEIERLVNRNYY